MKLSKLSLNIFIYGLMIPLTVALLADLAIQISCKYYWGKELLLGHSGFKLGMWHLWMTYTLTIIYYFFCVLFKLLKRKAVRYLLTVIFILVPILLYNSSSPYDIRITISYALFHGTFYVLFFSLRFFQKKVLFEKTKYINGLKLELFVYFKTELFLGEQTSWLKQKKPATGFAGSELCCIGY